MVAYSEFHGVLARRESMNISTCYTVYLSIALKQQKDQLNNSNWHCP